MRIDQYLVSLNHFKTRTKAQQAIEKGFVTINDKVCVKVSQNVNDSDKIVVTDKHKFVSNGGYKLEKAINDFEIDVSGLVFADIGASTGGFTDCLLQCGAKRVYAVDVGENQLDARLADDEKVVVMDNCNARFLQKSDFNDNLDGVVVDCSFISLKLLLEPIKNLLDKGIVIALIKPQFECGKSALNKGGILKDIKLRDKVVKDIIDYAAYLDFDFLGITEAPIKKDKNVEYLLYLKRGE